MILFRLEHQDYLIEKETKHHTPSHQPSSLIYHLYTSGCSLRQRYGAPSIVSDVQISLETAADEENLPGTSISMIFKLGKEICTAYTMTAEKTVAATAGPSAGSSVEPTMEW
jgi:hypothetical protein